MLVGGRDKSLACSGTGSSCSVRGALLSGVHEGVWAPLRSALVTPW